jgi:hypothetical protein
MIAVYPAFGWNHVQKESRPGRIDNSRLEIESAWFSSFCWRYHIKSQGWCQHNEIFFSLNNIYRNLEAVFVQNFRFHLSWARETEAMSDLLRGKHEAN